MVFAKADPRVQQLYEKSLVEAQYWEFGKLLREYVEIVGVYGDCVCMW